MWVYLVLSGSKVVKELTRRVGDRHRFGGLATCDFRGCADHFLDFQTWLVFWVLSVFFWGWADGKERCGVGFELTLFFQQIENLDFEAGTVTGNGT